MEYVLDGYPAPPKEGRISSIERIASVMAKTIAANMNQSSHQTETLYFRRCTSRKTTVMKAMKVNMRDTTSPASHWVLIWFGCKAILSSLVKQNERTNLGTKQW